MALTTLANVRILPNMRSTVKMPDAWLNSLISAADGAIKKFCKQNLELKAYVEYYDGMDMPDVVLKQFPVLSGTTQVAAGSNGVTLPTSTINVVSTAGFDPSGRSDLPTLVVQTGVASWTTVTYTGVTATSFTGCSGGTGTMSSQAGLNAVGQPAVFYDPTGYWGQRPTTPNGGPFAAGTIQVPGLNFAVQLDNGGTVGNRGLLRRLGGVNGGGYWGAWPQTFVGRSKLASYRLPCWPTGQGNIKVLYSAGYATIPDDLAYAATTLVVNVSRNQPQGAELSSESLGSYSYSVLSRGEDPEIGEVRQILTRYRENGW